MFRPEYLEALRLLSRAFDVVEERTGSRPVIVGGSAVEYYTVGDVVSGDFDLVAPDAEVVAEALVEVGFRREDRRGTRLGGLYHPELLIGVDFVPGNLFEGRTDPKRMLVVVVGQEEGAEGAKVVFPPPEDIIADRLGQYASDPKGRGDMLEQARLLVSLALDLDMDYLRKRVGEEGADPYLVDQLMADE